MAAAIQRHLRTCLFFGSIFLLGLACFAQLSEHHWLRHPGGSLAASRVGFLPAHIGASHRRSDTHRTPVFDPVLAYSTFLGGANAYLAVSGTILQGATAFFVDNAGNAYVAGNTNSSNFPVTPGAAEPSNPSQLDIGFVSKIAPTGKSLIFSTYLYGIEEVRGLAVDTAGDIYIAGNVIGTQPLPIPTGTSAFQSTPRRLGIIKLNSTATAVLNATYLGGSGQDFLTGIAADADGSLYVKGVTSSNDFPMQNPLQGSLGASGSNAFVTKMDSSLSKLVYSTYLG